MKNIEKAYALLENCNLYTCRNSSVKTTHVSKAETYLDIKFSETYKQFLLSYGFLYFGYRRIYGIIDDNFINSEVPDMVWLTEKSRKDFDLPHHIIPISDIGDGSDYALDLSQMNSEQECPVVVWPAGGYEETPELEIVAPDFGTWFLSEVREQISEKEKDDGDIAL